MIRGLHSMFYSPKADAMRKFLRDRLGLKGFDVGEGWLIFGIDGEIGCHPSKKKFHELSFWCDDIGATVKALKRKRVVFTMPVEDHGYGFVTCFKMPDGSKVQLYQPKYKQPKRRRK